MLIGQDRRKGEDRQRSDSIIICSVNKDKGEIILTSVMRDLYVPIPGYKDNRINAAYQFGGMELLDEVIEENLGVHIDGNVEVDFDGFMESLSVLGNLDIELNATEAKYLNAHSDLSETDETGWDPEGRYEFHDSGPASGLLPDTFYRKFRLGADRASAQGTDGSL